MSYFVIKLVATGNELYEKVLTVRVLIGWALPCLI